MSKRILIISAIVLGAITLALGAAYLITRKSHPAAKEIVYLVPKEAVFVLECKNWSKWMNNFSESAPGELFRQTPIGNSFFASWANLDSVIRGSEASQEWMEKETCIFSAIPDSRGNLHPLWVSALSGMVSPAYIDRFFQGLEASVQIEKQELNGWSVRTFSLKKGVRWYYYAGNNFFVISDNLSVIELSLSQITSQGIFADAGFATVYRPAGNVSDFHLTFKWEALQKELRKYFIPFTQADRWSDLKGWCHLSGGADKTSFWLKGITLAESGMLSEIMRRKGMPIPWTFIPTGVANFSWQPVSDTDLETNPLFAGGELRPLLLENSRSDESGLVAVLCGREDIVDANQPAGAFRDFYKGYQMGKVAAADVEILFPAIETDSVYVASDGLRIVYAPVKSDLQWYIDQCLTGLVYTEPETALAAQLALLFAPASLNPEQTNLYISEALQESCPWPFSVKRAYVQFTKKGNFMETEFRMELGEPAATLTPHRQFSVPEGYSLGPYPLQDRKGQLIGVAVFDTLGRMAFVDTLGQIVFRRNFSSIPKSEIFMYRETASQPAQWVFNNGESIFAIGADGSDRPGFPVSPPAEFGNILSWKYPDGDEIRLTYGFSEKKKEKIALLDGTGKQVKGFAFTETAGPVRETPGYIRIAGKDYLWYLETDGTVHLSDRTGKTHLLLNDRVSTDRNGPLIPMIKRSLIESYLAYSDPEQGMKMIFFDRGKPSLQHTIPTRSALLNITDIEKDGKAELLIWQEGQLVLTSYSDNSAIFVFPTGNLSAPAVRLVEKPKVWSMLVYDAAGQNLYALNETGNLRKGFPIRGVLSFHLLENGVSQDDELLVLTSRAEIISYRVADILN